MSVILARTARRCRLATALVSLTACSSFTDVAAPDVVQLSSLDNASGAEALRIGAISGFSLVYAGSTEGQIVTSGVITDEFFNASSGIVAIAAADLRLMPGAGGSYPYIAVHRARLDARRAITALEQYAPTRRAKIGEQFAFMAFTELFLGENMCSGIPLGEIADGSLVYGTPLSTDELFDRAIADFDSAVAYAADSARIRDMARVGRGRALLDRGRFADAAASVAAVAGSYVYSLQYSTAQPNGVFTIMNTQKWLTVSDREGGTGLDFRSARDPRVPTVLVGRGFDNVTDVYTYTSYASTASPIVLASGIEARLITAEATLRGGDAPGALGILNALRQTMAGLAPLPLEATDAARVDQLFRERAFWLFATGHRHGDLRRLVRQYGRPVASVFPTGAYKNGQTYGNDVTFAPDESQLSNAGYTGCTNRGA
jgi:hypothetical protein